MIVNSLLGYVVYCHKANAAGNIKMVILNYYKAAEIHTAAKILWSHESALLGRFQPRNDSQNRPAIDKYVDDILDAIRKLDMQEKLPDIVVRDLERVPDRNPEEINFLYYVNRVNDLEKANV